MTDAQKFTPLVKWGLTGPGYSNGCVIGIRLTVFHWHNRHPRKDGITQTSYAVQILFWELSLTVYKQSRRGTAAK